MADEIAGKTIRVPRQMVAEWDAIFERARAERAELMGVDADAVTPRQVWGEIIMVLGQRFLLGTELLPHATVADRLDIIIDRLDALDQHTGRRPAAGAADDS